MPAEQWRRWPNEVFFRQGDHANEVFFLQSGKVIIEVDDQRYNLEGGDFFGEIALLHDRTRMGTAKATSSCRLLVLERLDFDELCERMARLKEHFESVAQQRLEEGGDRPATLDDED